MGRPIENWSHSFKSARACFSRISKRPHSITMRNLYFQPFRWKIAPDALSKCIAANNISVIACIFWMPAYVSLLGTGQLSTIHFHNIVFRCIAIECTERTNWKQRHALNGDPRDLSYAKISPIRSNSRVRTVRAEHRISKNRWGHVLVGLWRLCDTKRLHITSHLSWVAAHLAAAASRCYNIPYIYCFWIAVAVGMRQTTVAYVSHACVWLIVLNGLMFVSSVDHSKSSFTDENASKVLVSRTIATSSVVFLRKFLLK